MHLGEFRIGKKLGNGRFGSVYLAQHKESGYIVALKVLRKREALSQGTERSISHEIGIGTQLRHFNLVPLYGWFHDRENVYIVMEYAEAGELYNKVGKVTVQEALEVVLQVGRGLYFLHQHGIVHRDIKPENILCYQHGIYKVGDLGGVGGVGVVGTLDYLAPESIAGSTGGLSVSPISTPVDVWACGVLLYELLEGRPPFERPTREGTLRAISKEGYLRTPKIVEDARVVKILERCLVKRGEERWTIREMVEYLEGAICNIR